MTWMPKLVLIALAGLVTSGCAATKSTFNDLIGRDQSFSSLDRNGDGVLSRTEASRVQDLDEAFEIIDSNSDNNINQNEFRAANTNVSATNFRNLDLNGDGVISKQEADASRRSLRETFDSIDADRDGNVSNAEYRAATQNLLSKVKFEDADLDGDGVLDREEVKQHPLVSAHFDSMDINGDSLVGPDEFSWAQR